MAQCLNERLLGKMLMGLDFYKLHVRISPSDALDGYWATVSDDGPMSSQCLMEARSPPPPPRKRLILLALSCFSLLGVDWATGLSGAAVQNLPSGGQEMITLNSFHVSKHTNPRAWYHSRTTRDRIIERTNDAIYLFLHIRDVDFSSAS